MRSNRYVIIIIAVMLACNCPIVLNLHLIDGMGYAGSIPKGALNALSGSREGPMFVNVTNSAGLSGVRGNFFSWGDYNNDGFEDLLAESRLFRNNGPPRWDFTETTGSAGIEGGGHGTWADFDNDGFPDLYMVGSNRLWKNDGPGPYGEHTFTDVTPASGIESLSHTTAVGWGDYDNDGLVDLYVARGENWNDGNAVYYHNVLYHNEGNGTFKNVTGEAGVDEEEHPGYSRGVSWADYNGDGWLDLYVANYRQQMNYLYENNGDGTFNDVAAERNVADGPSRSGENPDPYDRPGHSVGAIWGDYDNDGDLDLWVTNLNHKDWRTSDDSLLYRNDGPPDHSFTNVRDSAGIPLKPYVAPNEGDELFVGCAWEDFDNDGSLDLYLPQVYGDVGYAYSFLYRGNGDGTFSDATEAAGVRVWDTYASSWCDYDNDGMTDLLTAGKHPFENGTYEVRLYRNEAPREGNWLRLNLRGTDHNSGGIGAVVRINAGGNTFTRQVEGGMGAHGQQNSFPLDFGLGDLEGPVDAIVIWGAGKEQTVTGLEVNREHVITEVRDKPDIEMSALVLQDPHPIAGAVIDVTAVVSNTGIASMDRTVLGLYLDELIEGSLVAPPVHIENLGSTAVFEHVFQFNTSGLAGEHRLMGYVFDSDPAEEILTNNLVIVDIAVRSRNRRPEAVLTLSVDTVTPDELVVADGSGSEDDVGISKYLFDFGDGVTTGWIPEALASHEYDEAGEYEITLMVIDSDGALNDNDESLMIKVVKPPNVIPAAEILFVTPEEAVQYRNTVEFSGTGTDGDGFLTEYSWRSSLDGHLSSLEEFTKEAGELSVGEHIIFFRVRDDAGAWSPEASASLTIIGPNISPSARIEAIYPSPSEIDEVVLFKGSGSDVDGDIAGYSWNSSLDGPLSKQKEFTTSRLSTGEHLITLTVTDDGGAESLPVTRNHVVKGPNEPPVCRIAGYDPPEPVESEPVILYAEGDDPEDDEISFHWRSSLDGTLGNGKTFVVETGLSYGTHLIYLRAEDEGGGTSEEVSVEIDVGRKEIRPVLTHLTGPREGESKTVSVTAVVTGLLTDDFINEVRMELRVDGGRWTVVDESDITWENVDPFTRKWTLRVDVIRLDEGVHNLYIRVYDGTTYTNRLTLSFEVKHGEMGDVRKVDTSRLRMGIIGVGSALLVMVAVIIGYSMRVVRERRWKRELRRMMGEK